MSGLVNRLTRIVMGLGLAWLLPGCQKLPDHSQVWSQLEQAGYCRHLTEDEIETVRNAILKDGWSGLHEPHSRFFWVDAESLTEQGVTDFLKSLSPFLRRLNIEITSEDHWTDEGYWITLNGQKRVIWTEAEFEEERQGKPGRTWGLSTVRTFEMVNRLLEESGSDERLYAFNGGNDLHAMFLTPALADLIRQSSGWRTEDLPYFPVDDNTGWYGQPHDP